MRLAADYEQKNSHKQPLPNRHITRLGKGGPQQIRRKRGISRSQENSRIDNMSLGKGEVSQQKLSELQRSSYASNNRNTRVQMMPSKIVTTACYGNRQPQPNGDYASQHLLMTPVQYPTIDYPQQFKGLTAAKSQQPLCRTNQQPFYRNSSKIWVDQARRESNIPQRIKSPAQQIKYIRQPQQYRQVNHSPQINIKTINPQISSPKLQQNNAPVKHSSKKQVEIMRHESRVIRSPQAQQNIRNTDQPHRAYHVIEQMPVIKTEKKISAKDNPVRMSGTKKHQQLAPKIDFYEQLKATKKQARSPPVKEVEKLAESSELRLSKKKVTSIWQANKTESIVSEHPSQKIKMEQSEIMVDYFNSQHS